MAIPTRMIVTADVPPLQVNPSGTPPPASSAPKWLPVVLVGGVGLGLYLYFRNR